MAMTETAAPIAASPKAPRKTRIQKTYLIVDEANVLLPSEFAAKHELSLVTLLARLHVAFEADTSKIVRVPADCPALFPSHKATKRILWVVDGKVCSGFSAPAGASLIIDLATKKYSADEGVTFVDMEWEAGVFLGHKKAVEATPAVTEDASV